MIFAKLTIVWLKANYSDILARKFVMCEVEVGLPTVKIYIKILGFTCFQPLGSTHLLHSPNLRRNVIILTVISYIYKFLLVAFKFQKVTHLTLTTENYLNLFEETGIRISTKQL